MKKRTGLILCMGISCIAIVWLIQKVDWRDVQHTVRQVNVFWLISAAIIYLLGFFPRGLRWKLMLSPSGSVPLSESTQVVMLGYAVNNLMPFRLGELARAYLMGIKSNISKITCLGSIAAERIIDGIVIVMLLGLSSIFLTTTSRHADASGEVLLLGALIFLCAAIFMILSLTFSDAIIDSWKRLFGQRGLSFIENIIQSLVFLRTRRLLLRILILSVLIWLLEGSMFVLILWVMNYPHPVLAGYFCFGFVNLGILAPSAPGYFGVFQAASVFAFLSLGYSESAGLAYGLLVHLAQYIPITIIGVILLIRYGYRFGEFYKSISAMTQK
jgi:uncharacterized protein (TIRG00374 family)